MKQYVIIEIEQTTIQPDGEEVIIVKANEVKVAEELKYMEKMFGKRYYNIPITENDETEVFMFPYSRQLQERLVQIARKYEDGIFWKPNMNEFIYAKLNTPKGRITIHKYNKIKTQTYIPPAAEWEFKHKIINGVKILTFLATKTNVEDLPNGGFSWGSEGTADFVFSDNDESMRILKNAMNLNIEKKEFWVPDTSMFYHTQIFSSSSLGRIKCDLYIDYKLPKEIILNNLQDVLK